MGTAVHKFLIVRVNGEVSLLELSLVDTNAPQDKEIDTGLNIPRADNISMSWTNG